MFVVVHTKFLNFSAFVQTADKYDLKLIPEFEVKKPNQFIVEWIEKAKLVLVDTNSLAAGVLLEENGSAI